MCYISKFSFTSINETGERLSHAVGAAFKACLERKQELERANNKLTSAAAETSFAVQQEQRAVDVPDETKFENNER